MRFDWLSPHIPGQRGPEYPQKRSKGPEENVRSEYLRLAEAIEKYSDEVTEVTLKQALEDTKINQSEYDELLSELFAKLRLVSGHLTEVGIRLSEKVDHLSTDTITGLFKHELLKPELDQLLRELNPVGNIERRKKPLRGAVIVAIDVDNLKQWNSMHRSLGDRALQIISDSVRGVIKKNDYMFRRGDQSDEVLVIFRIDDTSDDILGSDFLSRMREAANGGFIEIDGKKLPVTAAVGYIILRPKESRSTDEILYAVDTKQQQDKEDKGVKEKRIREAQERLK